MSLRNKSLRLHRSIHLAYSYSPFLYIFHIPGTPLFTPFIYTFYIQLLYTTFIYTFYIHLFLFKPFIYTCYLHLFIYTIYLHHIYLHHIVTPYIHHLFTPFTLYLLYTIQTVYAPFTAFTSSSMIVVYNSIIIFFPHFYFPASGQKPCSQTGVAPSPPRSLPSIFIAQGIQHSHCSSSCPSVANSLCRAFRKSICAQERALPWDESLWSSYSKTEVLVKLLDYWLTSSSSLE